MSQSIIRSLASHEDIIESGLKSFLDVGRSLVAIRDGHLFPDDDFDTYCKRRWGLSRTGAAHYITAVKTVDNLVTIVTTDKKSAEIKHILPVNEAQARAVAAVSDSPKTQAAVWTAAVKSAPKNEAGEPQVTAALVKKTAAAMLQPTPPPTEREPGDDPVEPEHVPALAQANGEKPRPTPQPTGMYDDAKIESAIGALARMFTARANALGKTKSVKYRKCLDDLEDVLSAWRDWTKESR